MSSQKSASKPALPVGNRLEHLRRAKSLVATGKLDELRYAALELRLCLEAMTYDKLKLFADNLPSSFLEKTWQPPQLHRRMKQLDAMADESFDLHMGGIAAPGVPPKDEEFVLVGTHKAFELKWLIKNYNKLGSILHLQRNPLSAEEGKWRRDIVQIADEIENAQRGTILGSFFADKLTFECEICETPVTVSAQFARTQRAATCLNPVCETQFHAHVEGERIEFSPLVYKVACQRCRTEMRVHDRDMRNGLVLSCQSCKLEHTFRCRWEYGHVPWE